MSGHRSRARSIVITHALKISQEISFLRAANLSTYGAVRTAGRELNVFGHSIIGLREAPAIRARQLAEGDLRRDREGVL